jgi:hypothetical protein
LLLYLWVEDIIFIFFWQCILIVFPHHYAKANAASLPLGSINPYNKSYTLKISEYISFAEVPFSEEAL